MNKSIKVKNRIKEFRARHDLTQKELANCVDVRRETKRNPEV